jgi:uncharacterized protein YjdB
MFMKSNVVKLAVCVLVLVVPFLVSSCKSSKPTGTTTSVAAVQQGVPGGIFVETHEMTADVTALNAAKRTVTLTTADGKKTTVKCGPEVINFDQIRVGDKLKVLATEEVAIYMATGAPPADGGAALVALAPKGAKPGGIVASTVQATATVTAIDLEKRKATLQFADGTTHTVAVRPDVDLTQRKVGEQVVIRTTDAFAISVDKQ